MRWQPAQIGVPIPAAALVKRELLSSLRLKRTYALLALTVAMAAGMAVFLFMRQAEVAVGAMPAMAFFSNFMGILWLASILLVPPLAAVSVCGEKQQQTFELLATSLARPSGMLLAKLVNVAGVYLFIVLATMPVAGVIFFFVGIDWNQFGLSLSSLFLKTLACASIGLLASTRIHRPMRAIAFSYVGVALFVGNPLGSFLPVLPFFGGAARTVPVFLLTLAPVIRFFVALVQVAQLPMLPAVFLYYGILTLACLSLAWRTLRRPAKPEKVDPRKPIDNPEQLRERRRHFPFYLIDPLRRKKAIPDGRNPMLIKEQYTGLFNKGTVRVRAFYVYLILCLFFSFRLMLNVLAPRYGIAPAIAQVLFYETIPLLFFAPALIANTFAREYELGNMDMLRMTLLDPREIVLGKLYSAAISLLPMLLASVVCMAPAFLALGRSPGVLRTLYNGYGAMLVSLSLALAAGLRAGLFCQRTPSALVAAYLADLALFLGVPAGAAVVFMFLAINSLGGESFAFTLVSIMPSPMIAAFFTISDPSGWGRLQFFHHLNLFASAFLSFRLVLWSIRVFARDKMRER